jgi:hypothetical protein
VDLGEQQAAGLIRRAGAGGVKNTVIAVIAVMGGGFWLVLKGLGA